MMGKWTMIWMDINDQKDDIVKDDVEEHIFPDNILADIGVRPMKVEDAADWETPAHADLEECVEEYDGKTDVDVKDDAMRTYLTNTNPLSKRIVSAMESVETHSHFKSAGDERGYGGCEKQ